METLMDIVDAPLMTPEEKANARRAAMSKLTAEQEVERLRVARERGELLDRERQAEAAKRAAERES